MSHGEFAWSTLAYLLRNAIYIYKIFEKATNENTWYYVFSVLTLSTPSFGLKKMLNYTEGHKLLVNLRFGYLGLFHHYGWKVLWKRDLKNGFEKFESVYRYYQECF